MPNLLLSWYTLELNRVSKAVYLCFVAAVKRLQGIKKSSLSFVEQHGTVSFRGCSAMNVKRESDRCQPCY